MSREHAIAQLRHLYAQMIDPHANRDPVGAARGLLGPAITELERAETAPSSTRETPPALPPEIREILRDVAAGVTGPDLRGRAAAAITRRGLCPRCAGTGMELLDTGGAPGAMWGTCFGCAAAPASPGEPRPATTDDVCPWYADGKHRNCHAAASPATRTRPTTPDQDATKGDAK